MILRPQVVFIFLLFIIGIIASFYIWMNRSKLPVMSSSKSPETVLLKIQTPLAISGNITLTLTQLDLPPSHCMDCKATITVLATKDAQSQSLVFKAGGIQGESLLTQQAFDREFTVTNLQPNEVSLTIVDKK